MQDPVPDYQYMESQETFGIYRRRQFERMLRRFERTIKALGRVI